VVARDVGYVHEVVVDGVTGVLVGSDDAPRFLAAIRLALEGAATLGQAARARCLARFGMTSAASAWDAVLAETARCR
jgi:glycosyltransferase involved in cell wall biosynthesis